MSTATSERSAANPVNASQPSGKGRGESGGGAGGAGVLFGLLGVLILLVGGIIVLLYRGATPTPAGAAPVAGAAEAREQRVMEARAAFVEGNYDKAGRLLEALVAADARDVELHLLMAQVLCGKKEYGPAYEHIKTAIALDPESAAAPEMHFDAGTIANSAGRSDLALEHYSQAQQARPKEPRFPLYLAMIQIKLGQEAAAMASLVRTVNLKPDIAEAWGTMAELELKGNSLGLALDHFRKAKELQPDLARWRIGEAKVLKRRGDAGDAEAAAGLLVALADKDRFTPDALATLAECFGLLGKPRLAAEQYASAAEAKRGTPEAAQFHAKAAEWFERAGDAEAAGKHKRQAGE